MIEIYVFPSCLSSRKAIQFFQKNKISVTTRNLLKKPLTQTEIKELLQFTQNGVDDIITTKAKFIKNHAIEIENLKMSEIYDLIENSPTILKRPIILQKCKQRIQIGYNENQIELFLRKDIDDEVSNYFKIFK